MAKTGNGTNRNGTGAVNAGAGNSTVPKVTGKKPLDKATLDKVLAFRARLHETVGKVSLVLMATPRYRALPLSDLQHLVLEPLMQDRIAIAQPKDDKNPGTEPLAGIAFWASVDEATDAKIREQIRNNVFPVRLQAQEWNSGKINWLLDVIAPNQRLATAVIANFKQVIKDGDLRLHPMIARLVDPEALKKMGASPMQASPNQPLS